MKGWMKKNQNLIASFATLVYIVTIVIFIYHVEPFVYDTNDDMLIRSILSGELTGTPEYRTYYVSSVAGIIISMLYNIISFLPWYGLYLVGGIILMVWLLTNKLVERIDSVWKKVIASAFFPLVFIYLLYPLLIRMQYTTVTAIIVAGIIPLLLLSDMNMEFKKYINKNYGMIILLFYSASIRFEACLVGLPLIGIILCIKGVALHRNNKKNNMSISAKWLLVCLFFPLVILIITDAVAYSGESWNKYKRINEARTTIMDYNQYPSYEVAKSVCDKFEISENSYIALSQKYCIVLDDNINENSMSELADLADKERDKQNSKGVQEWLNYFVHTFKESFSGTYAKETVLLYVITLILIIACKQWTYIFYLIGVIVGRMIPWLYIIYRGRIVDRVTNGLWIIEIFALLGIIFELYFQHNKKAAWKSMLILITLTATFLLWIKPIKDAGQEADSRFLFAKNYEQIRDKFAENPDAFYLCDTFSFSYEYGESLSVYRPNKRNSVTLGGWAAKGPWYDKIREQIGMENWEDVFIDTDIDAYFVVQDIEGYSWDYIVEYYKEKYGSCEAKIEERVKTNDTTFLIVKLKVGE